MDNIKGFFSYYSGVLLNDLLSSYFYPPWALFALMNFYCQYLMIQDIPQLFGFHSDLFMWGCMIVGLICFLATGNQYLSVTELWTISASVIIVSSLIFAIALTSVDFIVVLSVIALLIMELVTIALISYAITSLIRLIQNIFSYYMVAN